MRCLPLVLACLCAAAQTQLQKAVQEGRNLAPEAASALEAQLATNPSLQDARARLIGYYFGRMQQLRQDTPDSVREARGRHVRWFIENDPASEVLATGEAFAMSGWMNDPENYRAMRELWVAEVNRSPNKLEVLKNATYLVQQHDRPLAVQLMRKAYAITSGNDNNVTNYYGTQLGLLWLGMGNDGSAQPEIVRAEIDGSKDARLVGSAGRTILQYADQSAGSAAYARELLTRAISLAPGDRMILV